MALRSTMPAVAAVIATAVAGWLYLDNRRLEARVDKLSRAGTEVAGVDPWSRSRADSGGSGRLGDLPGRGLLPWRLPRSRPPVTDVTPPTPPSGETRMERRARRTEEVERMLGRRDGESEAEYRERIMPMMAVALATPRARVDEMRQVAEEAAGVTDAQRRELDDTFGSVYDELIEFTDSAVADGQLTPYDRNVKGILQYAGGLGSILEGAEGRIGKILSPEQLRAMSDSGFEWGEYLGLRAPWERLRPPPTRPPGS